MTPSAYAAALAMLARRELSAAQLRDRLLRKTYPQNEVEAVVARLQRERAVDDRRTAALIARRAAEVSHRGPRRARQQIEAAGIAPELARAAVAEAYAEAGVDTVLERALDRRLSGAVRDRAHFEQLCRYLIRQGFDSDAAISALRARMAQWTR